MVLADDHALSYRVPTWWRNPWLIFLEATGLAILAFSYFYIRRGFDTWPPTRTLVPDLRIPSINLVVISVSVAPFWNAARLARRNEKPRIVGAWLALGVLFGLGAIMLRGYEFAALHTRFTSNAYGSITWTILAVHLAHLLAGTLEALLVVVVMFAGPVEKKNYTDATTTAVYWYFLAISWVILYALVFIAPRLR